MNAMLFGILGLNVLSLLLVLLRPLLYHAKLYRPMVLNWFLSILPTVFLLLANYFIAFLETRPTPPPAFVLIILFIVFFIIWLLLVPNSAYLITELNFSHRQVDRPGVEVPMWYDIVAVLSLALSGVVNAVYNVMIITVFEAILQGSNLDSLMSTLGEWVFVCVLMLLVSFAIYMGRYIRFNSWDLIHPVRFFKKLGEHFKQAKIGNFILFVVLHALLLVIVYAIIVR
jgi:uncharacterized membrane protein